MKGEKTSKPLFLWLLFHSFGIGCLSVSVSLQILVFWSICKDGKFIAFEQNPAILMFEVFTTAFAVIYLLYIIRERTRVYRMLNLR